MKNAMFFNDKTSNLLQQIAIFIEAAGFLLVIIEIYFPAIGRRIENTIDELSSTAFSNFPTNKHSLIKLNDLVSERPPFLEVAIFFTVVGFLSEWLDFSYTNSLLWIFSVYLLSILVAGVFYALMETAKELGKSRLLTYLLYTLFIIFMLPQFIIFICIPIFLVYYPMSKLLSLFDLIGRGRAVGALGLFLSLIGLSFEVYQIITLCLSTGCYGN